MDPWPPSEYGERNAHDYDARYPTFSQEAACLQLLSEQLRPAARITELGAGTGRIAIRLAAAGYSVCAIDASPAMLARLRARPGAAHIEVIEGDIGTCVMPETDAVVCLFNTFFQLQTQEAQINCFRRVSDALVSRGLFALEAWVPDFSRYRERHSFTTAAIDNDGAMLEAAMHDPVTQIVESQSIYVGRDAVEIRPLRQRYAWPAELDVMAQLAGLELLARYADWTKTPFSASSHGHLSLYQKPY